MAERVGFEPTAPYGVTGFQDRLLKPLGHLSTRLSFLPAALLLLVQASVTYLSTCLRPVLARLASDKKSYAFYVAFLPAALLPRIRRKILRNSYVNLLSDCVSPSLKNW